MVIFISTLAEMFHVPDKAYCRALATSELSENYWPFEKDIKATGPSKVAEVQVLENVSEVVKCEYSYGTEKENGDLERSTFFNPGNLTSLEIRMDERLTMQI